MAHKFYKPKIVIYLDREVGLPLYGLFITNVMDEADQTFVANEHIQDFMDEFRIPELSGFAEFMGRIPRSLIN